MSHTRLRTTILHSEGRDCKRYFERPDGEPWEAAQTALQGSRWVTQFERKERNETYPLDLERFVQLTTSKKHWPVINAMYTMRRHS